MNLKRILAAFLMLASSSVFPATIFSDTFPQFESLRSEWTVPAGTEHFDPYLGPLTRDPGLGTGISRATLDVNAPAGGPGSVTFDFLAFRGVTIGPFEIMDALTFRIGLTGDIIFRAAFQSGATLPDYLLRQSVVGATVTPNGLTGTSVRYQSYTVTVPVVLAAGPNRFSWSYREDPADLDQAYWGLDNVLVTGPDAMAKVSASVVPVPGAALLLATGLAGLGFVARRRKA